MAIEISMDRIRSYLRAKSGIKIKKVKGSDKKDNLFQNILFWL